MDEEEKIIIELLPTTLYCTHAEVVEALIKSGMVRSVPTAYNVCKSLTWHNVGDKNRKIISTRAVKEFLMSTL